LYTNNELIIRYD